MESVGIPLGEYVKGKIYRGIVTGFNEAFMIDGKKRDELIKKCPQCAEVIKPLAVGDDVRKWHIRNKDKYLLYMYHGIDVSNLQAIIDYLQPYRQKLEKRATQQAWYELQQPQLKYAQEFDKPKIVYPIIAKESRFSFDRNGLFINE
jgi:hypothetical protein